MNRHFHRLVFNRARGLYVAVAETVAASGKSASGERRSRLARASVVAALALTALAAEGQGLSRGSALTGVAPKPILPPSVAVTKPTLPPGTAAPLLPTGATVVKGAGTISVVGGDMTVNQSTARLVTDWQSFSIGAGNSVRFVQPSTSSVALNRVTGDDPSAIFGALTANGHVYLQNGNGVYFAPGSQVSVGSLVATTLNIDVGEFMLGKLRLSGGSEASGSVDNAGSIVAAPGGHVVLAAPVVSNSGSITTPGGTTALVAGNAVDIDPLGSGLLSISVPVAAVNARLAQSGSITADGGAVLLAAAANDAALRTVMQVGGVVRARSIESRDGQIVLSGGGSGAVMVDGQLDASAGAAGQGGTIKVFGDLVGVTGSAKLDASGGTAGGTILVGGNWQGKGPEVNASSTYVGSGVILDASATGKGDGGKVVVWADGNTNYFGQANARGGADGGNGGQIEVSGKSTLNFQGGADLTAPRGKTGSLLLDPQFLTVGTVADRDGNGTPGDDLVDNIFAADPGVNSQITATRVATLLNTASVTLQSQFGLTVSAPVTVAAGGAATTLALQSANVTISAPMTLNNASLTASTTPTFTTQSIVLDAAVSSNNSVSLTSPTITLNAPLTAPNVSLSSFGTISQNAAGIVNATNLTLAGGGDANLNTAANQVRNLSMVGGGDINLSVTNPAGVPLSIGGTADTVTLVATNTDITQSLAPSGAITLGVGEGGPFAIATTGSGNVTLNNPANDISGGVVFNVAGGMSLRVAGSLGAEGSATGDVALVAGGIFTLENGISGRNIDISSAGFVSDDELLTVQPGGRFFIRSSDYTLDDFNSPAFGTGTGDINYVILSGYTGPDPTSGNGYYTNQTGAIDVAFAPNPPVSKVYDGTPTFVFTQSGGAGGSILLNNPSPNEVDKVGSYTIVSTGTFTDENAGINKGHTVAPTNDVVALGAASGAAYYGLRYAGYTRAPGPYVAGQPGNAISQITPRPITSIGVDGIDRVYDATTTVGVSLAGASLVGTIGGDTVALSGTGATGTMADKNVGINKPIAVTGLTLTGADAGNYTVTDASGANVTITPRPIASTGLDGVDRVYDGTTVVAINGSAGSLVGVLGGDTVGVAAGGATGSIADKNVGGAKPVTIVGVGLNGVDAGNYTVTDASGATVAITPRPIVAIGIDGVDRVYNGGTAVGVNTAGASLSGTIGGDTVSLVASGATGTLGDKNVGVDKPVTVGGLALAGADAGNYTVSGAAGANATISALGITSSGFTGVNRVYDGTTVVAVNGGAATLTGVLSGDSVAVAGGSGSVANKNVGTAKPVTVGGITLSGIDAGNYTVTDTGGALVTITPLGITSTGVTGVDRSYDGTTVVAVNTSTAALNGTIAGDNVTLVGTGANGTMADKNAGVAKPITVGGLTLGGADAVNYSLVDASNATVNIAALVLVARGITATDRVVDGTTTVQIDASNATVTGVLPGDTVGIDPSGAIGSVATPDPGAAKVVTVVGIDLTGPDAINYSIAPVPLGPSGGGLTVRILSVNQGNFEDIRFNQYLQAVSDAQEPFRRAMAEALASGFGKENIRKQLQRGLVFETGLAPPAVDIIEPAAKPESCSPPGGADLNCAK